MAQALALGLTLRRPRSHPAPFHVAYAAHFRALMEFFHDARPNRPPTGKDWILTDFLPLGVLNPLKGRWSTRVEARFVASDKLVGHLSRDRRRRHHASREWGSQADHSMIVRKVRLVFRLVPKAAAWFPKTAQILPRC